MRVQFDNCNFGARTGPNTFAQRLAMQLFNMGHEVIEDDRADVALVFIEPTGRPLAPKVVQRLDGIWFKPHEFEAKNRGIKALYDRADAVVFQSRFDEGMVMRHWGSPAWHQNAGSTALAFVINNGIDLSPVTQLTIPKLVEMRAAYDRIYVCSSNWHPQKRLEANVRLFERLRQKHPNSCLVIMGDHPDFRASGPNVFYTGSVDHETSAQIYSAADWMLHLAWADHCPNVVIEALAQGTPVACSRVGGTRELVGAYGKVLKEQTYNYELADYDSPPDIDVGQVEDLPPRKELDYSSIADIDIRHVAEHYLDAFRKVCE